MRLCADTQLAKVNRSIAEPSDTRPTFRRSPMSAIFLRPPKTTLSLANAPPLPYTPTSATRHITDTPTAWKRRHVNSSPSIIPSGLSLSGVSNYSLRSVPRQGRLTQASSAPSPHISPVLPAGTDRPECPGCIVLSPILMAGPRSPVVAGRPWLSTYGCPVPRFAARRSCSFSALQLRLLRTRMRGVIPRPSFAGAQLFLAPDGISACGVLVRPTPVRVSSSTYSKLSDSRRSFFAGGPSTLYGVPTDTTPHQVRDYLHRYRDLSLYSRQVHATCTVGLGNSPRPLRTYTMPPER
ncbi:hypothetical protein C8Q78DRAFT_123984 [Trametes maxima]|nr:hypothetical protein C8Q78DRAFT_123984 [Trametes maxima]